MAQARVHSLIGDSNIRNHINKTTCRTNPVIKATQYISCGRLEIFAEALHQVRAETNVCLISCLSNFICSASGPTSVAQRVEPVLQDVLDGLCEICEANPACQYLLSPPMYRTTPVWYREGLPEILTLFSQIFTADRPPNLHLLSSFATPEYDSGGVHLTPYSGLQFILHLFESAHELLDNLNADVAETSTRVCEATRVLEDRVMVLEQDHRRLNGVVEHKIAIDSELADFQSNERTENCLLIGGLPAISNDLAGKEWQTKAVQHVQEAFRLLMGREYPILFVKNATKRFQGAEVTYNVHMIEASDSRAIRTKFGTYFVGGDKRPDNIKFLSIKNFVTPETNTRISVMKLIAKRYRDMNPGSKVQVIGYAPRPVIKITPAPSATDRRVKMYHYVEAVTKLPVSFASSDIDPVIKRINPGLLGKIRSTFIIITDDDFKRVTRVQRQRNQATEEGSGEGSDTEMSESSEAAPPIISPSVSTVVPVSAAGAIGHKTSDRNQSNRSRSGNSHTNSSRHGKDGANHSSRSGSGSQTHSSRSKSRKRNASANPDDSAPNKK